MDWESQSTASGATPHGLHLNYDVDFRSQRVGDITSTLTSPLLPHLVSDLLHLERPQPAGPPLPQSTLPQPPSEQPPSQEDERPETYSPGSASSEDSMGARRSKPETPTIL